MRILTKALLIGGIVAASGLYEGKSTNNLDLTGNSNAEVDSVITGHGLPAGHLENWEAQSKRYKECPECVASQPFPGE